MTNSFKKVLSVFIFSFVLSSLALAESLEDEKNWIFTVEPFFGITYGQMGEHLYSKDSSGEYKQVSYLEWEEKPLFLLGANLGIKYKRFSINPSVSFAIPASCGNMYDSDWIELTDLKTNYSISENTVYSYLKLNLQFAFEFKPLETFSVIPITEIQYSYASFNAANGYGWYGDYQHSSTGTNVSYSSPYAKYYEEGSLCELDYKRYEIAAFAGFTLKFTPLEKWIFTVSAEASPIAYTMAFDTHYQNAAKTASNDYLDIILSYFAEYKLSTSAYFILTKHSSLGVNVSGYISKETQGYTYKKSSSEKYAKISNQLGGTSEKNIQLAISYKFIF
ncbi:MAG: hypothetical protein K6F69_11425 [Treponema sp.]|nr:hypothetical protein [Treponema sp.]